MKLSFFKIYYLILILPLFISCSQDDQVVEEEVYLEEEIMLNVSYGNHPQQVYDLYLPAGRTSASTPVIMLIHGGGWTGGDKSDMTQVVYHLQNLHPGYAVVNVNYVLATESIPAFPNQFLDIQSIVNKLTSEKETLQIKPQFGFIGASAGAHIAMMYDYAYDTQDQVKFVANVVGPSDFTDPFYSDQPNFDLYLAILTDLSAYPPGTNLAQTLSPVYQISPLSSPTCSFYGTTDPLVPVSNGISLHDQLTEYGIYNTLKIYVGGHADDWSPEDLADMTQIISSYIDAYLPK